MWRKALFSESGRVNRLDHPDQSRVAVGVTAPVNDFVMRAAEGNLGPLAPRSEAATGHRTFRGAEFDVSPSIERVPGPRTLVEEDRTFDVRAGTMRSWEEHLVPVVVKLEAPWTSFRSLGSCYVQLPRLLRTHAEYAALPFAANSQDFGA
jgi:hypothetical protein